MSSTDEQPVKTLKIYAVYLRDRPLAFHVTCDDFRDSGRFVEFHRDDAPVAVFTASDFLGALHVEDVPA